ncbi:MAG TPA: lysophospholipase [Anaerolineae bacterium]|nr:lysophospholipase [Anaerolineae bacterium]HQI84923.1 lysophospholipase [Anaerolineae bacterium]
MEHCDGFLQGVRNAKIYYQAWLPETECKAVLLIVHGLAEHCGRYMNVVNHFVPLGYAVYGLDHIGHGKSEGARVYVDRFTDYTDTLKRYFDAIRLEHPDKPVFLVGHSMGGLIGALYLLEHQNELAGAVLSGPLVKMAGDISPMVVFMGKLLSVLMPKTGLTALAAEGISRDPAVVQAYVNDPLVYTGKITARLAGELVAATQRITAEAAKITLPLLIVQGSEDKLVDPAGAKLLYDTVSSVDKTLKIYEGFYHEVFNEPGRAQVLGDVEAWLAQRA